MYVLICDIFSPVRWLQKYGKHWITQRRLTMGYTAQHPRFVLKAKVHFLHTQTRLQPTNAELAITMHSLREIMPAVTLPI